MDELVDDLGPPEVAQAVLAEADELRTLRQTLGYQRGEGARHKHLSTVGRAHKPSSSVDLRAEVIAVALFGFSRMQSHPHADGIGCGPSLVGEPELGLDRGIDGRLGARKHGS